MLDIGVVIGFQVHFKDSVKVTHYGFRDEMRLGGGNAFNRLKYNYLIVSVHQRHRSFFVVAPVNSGSSQNTTGDKLENHRMVPCGTFEPLQR